MGVSIDYKSLSGEAFCKGFYLRPFTKEIRSAMDGDTSVVSVDNLKEIVQEAVFLMTLSESVEVQLQCLEFVKVAHEVLEQV